MITIMFTGCKSSNDKIMYMYEVDDRHYDLNSPYIIKPYTTPKNILNNKGGNNDIFRRSQIR